MARKSLHIVANEATKRILAQLGSPLVQVAVKGRVVKGAQANTFVIENISTSKSTSLPIIASECTKKALSEAASGDGHNEVTLLGRVIEANGTNTLMLDGVGKAQSLAIVADDATRSMLVELAKANTETTVKAKVVDQGGAKVLVLTGEKKKK